MLGPALPSPRLDRLPRRRLLTVAAAWALAAGGITQPVAAGVTSNRPHTAQDRPASLPAWPPADATAAAHSVVRWSLHTGDHGLRAFAVIDKPAARIHVFSEHGQWQGSSAVLLGAAKGDYAAPDIGQRALRDIAPHERTTPAGRFVSEPGRNLRGDDIVWIDYDTAVSLHRVRSASAAERRLQRLASPGAGNKRISYGCVNVPEAFYHQHIAPVFGQAPGIIYVLPDTEPLATFFEASSPY